MTGMWALESFQSTCVPWQNGSLDICASCLAVIFMVVTIVSGPPSPTLPILPHDWTRPGCWAHLPRCPLGLLSPSPSAACSSVLSTPRPCPSPKAFPISLFHGFSHLVSTWLGSACLLTSASTSPGTAALPVANNGCCQIFHSEQPTFPGCPSSPLGLS